VFVADNALLIDVSGSGGGEGGGGGGGGHGGGGGVLIRVNEVQIQVSTVFFNEAISFVPCFKYADSDDVILFASKNFHYLVDSGGQFCPDYYGHNSSFFSLTILCFLLLFICSVSVCSSAPSS
jgi:hypothetical protein